MTLSMGTNGVRGLFDELGPSQAMDLGFGFAHFVKSHPRKGKAVKEKTKKGKISKSKSTSSLPLVALARDMRLTSPCIFEAAAAGLMEGGAQVADLGVLTAPASEWTASRIGADGLVIVTASHNPPEWNALKFVDADGVAVSRERGASIAHFINKPHHPVPEWPQMGKIEAVPNVIEEYQKAVLRFVNRRAISASHHTLRVVADPGNGTSTLVAPAILRSLGVKAKFINNKLDGRFPGRPSEPAQANLKALTKAVIDSGADMGVAWDGDADRVTFVDEKGRWISGDMGVALSAKWALFLLEKEKKKKKKGSGLRPSAASPGVSSFSSLSPIVVTTVATSRVVEEAAAAHGAKTEYTDVGAPYLSERVHALGDRVAMAGEEVGGIVWPSFSLAKDGVLAACKLLEMAAYAPLSEWVDTLPRFFTSKLKIACPPGANLRLAASFQKELQSDLPSHALLKPLKGGFRIDFESAWVLVRASGTENYVRVFAEAREQEEADSLARQYQLMVSNRLREIDMV